MQIWENRTYFERNIQNAGVMLNRMNGGFHRRLKARVLKCHADNVDFTLSDLENFLLDNLEVPDVDNAVSFTFLSTVEFLRQSLTHTWSRTCYMMIFLRARRTCGIDW